MGKHLPAHLNFSCVTVTVAAATVNQYFYLVIHIINHIGKANGLPHTFCFELIFSVPFPCRIAVYGYDRRRCGLLVALQ